MNVQGTKEYRKATSALTISSQTIVASGNYTSSAVDLNNNYGVIGSMSLQLILTGDGTAKVEYLISADGINYITPSSASDIVTAFTKTSGSNSDGKDIFTLTIPVAKYIKIKFTETSTTDNIVVNAILLIK